MPRFALFVDTNPRAAVGAFTNVEIAWTIDILLLFYATHVRFRTVGSFNLPTRERPI